MSGLDAPTGHAVGPADNRLRARMAELAAGARTGLVIYITQADPTPAATVDIAVAAAEGGADVIELGVPFSDPSADGVVIQRAMQRALAAGGGLDSALATVESIRARGCEIPIVLFGYYNPILISGVEAFAERAARAGVDATLTVDVPVDELAELAGPLRARGIDVIPLLAPTSGTARMAMVRRFAPPFVYYISMTGVTGSAFQGVADGLARVRDIRAESGAPVAVGFGIKTGAQARAVAAHADAVVVGSAVVRRIEDARPGEEARAVGGFVSELRAALDAPSGDTPDDNKDLGPE